MQTLWKRLKKTGELFEKHIKDNSNSFSTFNIYCQDESRFGLFTRNGRALTARGIKPICPYQHKFDNLYLFGAFSPINGDSFLLEMPYCNTDTFQHFVNELSLQKPDEFKILILDNGAFHKAERLTIPYNMAFIFLPPYSPELNPAEQIWRIVKIQLINKTFKSIKELSIELALIINKTLTVDFVKSIANYHYYVHPFRTIFGV